MVQTTSRRRWWVALLVVGALLVACSDDDDATPDTSAAPDTEATTGTEATTDTEATTEATDLATADLVHDSTLPAVEACEITKTRNVEEIVALLSEDAVFVNNLSGETAVGPDAIASAIGTVPGWVYLETTDCGEAIASNWWSAVAFAFRSDPPEPGGTGVEGILAVRVTDGEIDQIHTLATLGVDPNTVDEVWPDAEARATAWCEAWGTLDPEQVIPLAAADLVISGQQGPLPGVGAEPIRALMTTLQQSPNDTVECGDTIVSNGGWIALTARFVDTDGGGGSWGGILAVQLTADGSVGAMTYLMDAMDADGAFVPS